MTFDPDQKQAIYDHLCEMPTVDAHEHLHPEPMRCERKVDIFLLFHQYLRVDLICAGMDEQAAADLDDENVPLDRKWASLAPYLDLVRSGSVAQPPFIALRKFFDADDLTEDNYAELSARMQEHNRPGLYEKCLREACNIVLVLNQNRTMWQTDLFKPILHGPRFIGTGSRQSLIEGCAEDDCEPPADLDSYLAQMEGRVRRHKANGMLGVKGHLHPYVPGDKDAARRAYPRLMADRARAHRRGLPQGPPLRAVRRAGPRGRAAQRHLGGAVGRHRAHPAHQHLRAGERAQEHALRPLPRREPAAGRRRIRRTQPAQRLP